MAEDPVEEVKKLKADLRNRNCHLADAERAKEQLKQLLAKSEKDKAQAEAKTVTALKQAQRDHETNLRDANEKLAAKSKQLELLERDLSDHSKTTTAATASEQSLQSELKAARKEISELRANAQAADQRHGETVKRRDSHSFEAAAFKRDLEDANQEKADLSVRLAAVRRDLETAQNRASAEQKKRETAERDADRIKDEAKYVVEGQEETLAELRRQGDQDRLSSEANLRSLEAKVQSAEQRASEAAAALDSLYIRLAEAERDHQLAADHVNELQAERQQHLSTQTSLETEVRQLRADKDGLIEAATLAVKEAKVAKDLQSALDQQLVEVHARHEQAVAEVASTRQRAASCDRQLDGVRGELDRALASLAETQRARDEIQVSHQTIELHLRQTTADFDTATTNLAEIRAEAEHMRSRLDHYASLPSRSFEDAFVKSLQAEQDALVGERDSLRNDLEELRTVEKELGDQLIEVDRLAREREDAQRLATEQRIEELESDLDQQRASFASESTRAGQLDAQLLRAHDDLNTLQQHLDVVSRDYQTLQSEQTALQERRSSEAFRLATSQRQNDDYAERLDRLEQRLQEEKTKANCLLESAAQRIADLEAAVTESRKAQATLQSELSEAHVTRDAAREALVDVEGRLCESRRECNEMQQQFEAAKVTLAQRSQPPAPESSALVSMAEAEALVARLRQERDSAVGDKTFVDNELLCLRTQYERRSNDVRAGEERIDELRRELESINSVLANAEALASDRQQELAQVKSDLQAVKIERQTTVGSLQDQLAESESNMDQMKSENHLQSGAVATLSEEVDSLSERLRTVQERNATDLRFAREQLAKTEHELAQTKILVEQQDADIASLEEERKAEKQATTNALALLDANRQSERPTLPSEFSSPRTASSELWKQNASLEQDNAALTVRIKKLEVDLMTLQAKIGRRQDQIARQQAELQRAQMQIALLTPSETADSAADATCLSVEADTSIAAPRPRLSVATTALAGASIDLRQQLRVSEETLCGVILTLLVERRSRQSCLAHVAALSCDLNKARALCEATEAMRTEIEAKLVDVQAAHDARLQVVETVRAEERTSRAASEGAELRIHELCGQLGEERKEAERRLADVSVAEAQYRHEVGDLKARLDSAAEQARLADELVSARDEQLQQLSQELQMRERNWQSDKQALQRIVQQKEDELHGNAAKQAEAESLIDDFNRATAAMDEAEKEAKDCKAREVLIIEDHKRHVQDLEAKLAGEHQAVVQAHEMQEALKEEALRQREAAEEASDQCREALKLVKKHEAKALRYKDQLDRIDSDLLKRLIAEGRIPESGSKRASAAPDHRSADLPAKAILQQKASPLPHAPASSDRSVNFVPIVGAPASASFKPAKKTESRARMPLAPLAQSPSNASTLQMRLNAMKH